MPDNSTMGGSLIDAVLNLESTAAAVAREFRVARHGLIFERSGDSMAVFDGNRRIDRVDLPFATEQAFLEAIDAWELARYVEVA